MVHNVFVDEQGPLQGGQARSSAADRLHRGQAHRLGEEGQRTFLMAQSRPVTLPIIAPQTRKLTFRELKEIEAELKQFMLQDYLAWTSTHPDASKVERSARATQ